MKAATVFILAVGFSFACDKAKDGLQECSRLEAAGRLVQAVAACTAAHEADPETTSGNTALNKAAEIQAKLDEVVPATVTLEWCGRLRRRLEERLTSEARSQYGSGSEGIVHDNVLNVEHNCDEAVGRPTVGLWKCRWDEHLSNYKDCDGYAEKISDCKRQCLIKWRECLSAAGADQDACKTTNSQCEMTCDG